jgi:hypothetical protein
MIMMAKFMESNIKRSFMKSFRRVNLIKTVGIDASSFIIKPIHAVVHVHNRCGNVWQDN